MPASLIRSDFDHAYPVFFSQLGVSRYAAVAPDLPGCTCWGETREEARQRIRQAIQLWIESAHLDGAAIPAPGSALECVEVDTTVRGLTASPYYML